MQLGASTIGFAADDVAMGLLPASISDRIRDVRHTLTSARAGEDGYGHLEAVRRLEADCAAVSAAITDDLMGTRYDPVHTAAAAQALQWIGEVQDEVRRRALDVPFERLGRVSRALDTLGQAGSSSALAEAVSTEVCAACGFDRAMISYVQAATWVPHRLFVANEPSHPANLALRDFARNARIPLATSMLETELVRRRAPALIHDAQDDRRTFRPVVELSMSRSYVVAPIVAAGSVVGLFHADTFSSGRLLTDHDRDEFQWFADGFGLLFEQAVLRERLARGHSAARTAFAEARERTARLVEAPVRFEPQAVDVPARARPSSGAGPEGTFGLTPREREVLVLLAGGATNNQIAFELVVAQSTVKSHVKHIMRKLGAANRAEAVSQFLRMSRKQQVVA